MNWKFEKPKRQRLFRFQQESARFFQALSRSDPLLSSAEGC